MWEIMIADIRGQPQLNGVVLLAAKLWADVWPIEGGNYWRL